MHIDTIFCPKVDGRPERFLYVAIERTSKWLYIEARASREAKEAALFMENLIKRCPLKIHTILTDNGVEWKADFEEMVTDPDRAIKYRHTKPRTPQTNGCVERMNGTIKRKTPFKTKAFWVARPEEQMTPGRLLQGAYPTGTRLARANASVRQYTFFWNAVLPHKLLNWQTPLKLLQALYKEKPELFNFDPSRDMPLDLEDWKSRIGANQFIYPPPGIGNRTPS